MESLSHVSVTSGRIDALAGRLSGDAKMENVSEDFEALFVSMMLKTMRESMSKDMFAGDGSDTFGGLFDSFMGQHLAEHGGLGLMSSFDNSVRPADPDLATKALPATQPTVSAQNQLKAYESAVATGE